MISKMGTEILDISVEELLNAQKRDDLKNNKTDELINIVLMGVGLAMGVCVVVTSILKKLLQTQHLQC